MSLGFTWRNYPETVRVLTNPPGTSVNTDFYVCAGSFALHVCTHIFGSAQRGAVRFFMCVWIHNETKENQWLTYTAVWWAENKDSRIEMTTSDRQEVEIKHFLCLSSISIPNSASMYVQQSYLFNTQSTEFQFVPFLLFVFNIQTTKKNIMVLDFSTFLAKGLDLHQASPPYLSPSLVSCTNQITSLSRLKTCMLVVSCSRRINFPGEDN